MFRRLFTIGPTLVAALLPMVVMAQTGSSTITGAIRDSSGGMVPGAAVRVVNEDTGASTEAVSDGQGVFSAPALAAGRYRLETALDGFETVVNRIVLSEGQTAANDVTLSPARFSQSVVVTARRIEDVQALRGEGLEALQLDVTSSASIDSALAHVFEQTGGELYGLFNNAGYGQPGAVEDLSRDALREQFDGVFSAFDSTRTRRALSEVLTDLRR